MKKPTLKQFARRIAMHQRRLVKQRDALRELIADAQALEEDMDDGQSALRDAVHALDEGADCLSRHV